jgi:hypothetical protein
MVSGVVTIGRNRYAVGLYWENSPGSGRVAQTAKEAASQPGQQADFYAVRPGNKNGRIPQFGLATAENGQKAGMPVLVGCLASQIPGSWAGAFRLNEGVALMIVRDDLIVPDGDLFFLDEAEARDRLIQEVGFGGLQTVYAPESWSIPSADTIPLTLLLSDRRDIKLQQVHVPKKIKIMAGVAAAVFILILSGAWYWEEKLDEEAQLRAQQEEAIRRAQDATKKLLPSVLSQPEAPPPTYDRVWEKMPPAMGVINACREGLTKIPVAVAGWRMGPLKCSDSAITLNWTREKGMAGLPPGGNLNDSSTSGAQNVGLPHLNPRGPENLLDSDVIAARYLAQNWPTSLGVAPNDPLPSPPADYTGPWNPPPPPWVKRSFTLTVSELPGELPDLIGDIPGVVINSLSYGGASSASWTVEGVIYENRK